MIRAIREHWPEYLCEAAELGLFMISAGLFTILLHHPESPMLNCIPSEFVRRMLTVIAMGSTAIMLVFSPLGKRSGAHFNPAVTLTFFFFFSSRRRHTRFSRDWSSDVCSSDLATSRA